MSSLAEQLTEVILEQGQKHCSGLVLIFDKRVLLKLIQETLDKASK